MYKNKDEHFHLLIRDINKTLTDNKDGSTQQEQVELLMKLEDKFKKSIWKFSKQAREIYKAWILLILIENGNVLSGRPYFRERANVYWSKITPAIKSGNIDELRKYHVNYNFISFVVKHWKGALPEATQALLTQLTEARRKLIENNIPLALNRAKIFYRKTNPEHMTLNDMIGLAVDGLISGVDKWTGKYSRVFLGVCIGRMVGNFTEANSDTQVYFYPSDRQIIYRARSLKYRHKIEDLKTLVKVVNESLIEDKKQGRKVYKKKVTEGELANLMTATSTLSTDELIGDSDGSFTHMDLIIKNNQDIEKIDENSSLYAMYAAIDTLPLKMRKIIKLKGVHF